MLSEVHHPGTGFGFRVLCGLLWDALFSHVEMFHTGQNPNIIVARAVVDRHAVHCCAY